MNVETDSAVMQEILPSISLPEHSNEKLKINSLSISTHYNVILTVAVANPNVDPNNITNAIKGKKTMLYIYILYYKFYGFGFHKLSLFQII